MNIQSIHLQKLPNIVNIPFSQNSIDAMEFVRKICNAGLSIRKKNNIKARIPLQSITIAGENISITTELQNLIKDELNVKNIIFQSNLSQFNCTKIINIDASKVAKKIGKDFQNILKQAKQGIYQETSKGINISGYDISNGEFDIQIRLNSQDENYTSLDGKYLIIMDIVISKELEMEGIARDFIRLIQNTRKERNLQINQKITLKLAFSEGITKESIMQNLEYIKTQVLCDSVEFSQKEDISFNEDMSFDIYY